MNEEEGVGVLLTSHDASDLEALCRRVIIINHGQIVYQDKVPTSNGVFLPANWSKCAMPRRSTRILQFQVLRR